MRRDGFRQWILRAQGLCDFHCRLALIVLQNKKRNGLANFLDQRFALEVSTPSKNVKSLVIVSAELLEAVLSVHAASP